MKPYGAQKRDITENCAIRKGYYGRYGAAKTKRLGYKATEIALKKRERAKGKLEAKEFIEL